MLSEIHIRQTLSLSVHPFFIFKNQQSTSFFISMQSTQTSGAVQMQRLHLAELYERYRTNRHSQTEQAADNRPRHCCTSPKLIAFATGELLSRPSAITCALPSPPPFAATEDPRARSTPATPTADESPPPPLIVICTKGGTLRKT